MGKNWVKTITEMPTSELLEKLSSGGLKSTEVLKAFVSKVVSNCCEINNLIKSILIFRQWKLQKISIASLNSSLKQK